MLANTTGTAFWVRWTISKLIWYNRSKARVVGISLINRERLQHPMIWYVWYPEKADGPYRYASSKGWPVVSTLYLPIRNHVADATQCDHMRGLVSLPTGYMIWVLTQRANLDITDTDFGQYRLAMQALIRYCIYVQLIHLHKAISVVHSSPTRSLSFSKMKLPLRLHHGSIIYDRAERGCKNVCMYVHAPT